MIKLKYLFASLLVVGFNINPTVAVAQQFNAAVSNPFSFCSAPKPCRKCQPFRAHWEQICPQQKESNKNITPDPVIVTNPSTPINNTSNMSQSEIRDEIARLTPIWEAQTQLSVAAQKVLQNCIDKNGPVQQGYCASELADFQSKRSGGLRDEIYRLQALLRDSGSISTTGNNNNNQNRNNAISVFK